MQRAAARAGGGLAEVKRALAAVLVWPLLLVLAVPAYGIGLLVILRDLWRRR